MKTIIIGAALLVAAACTDGSTAPSDRNPSKGALREANVIREPSESEIPTFLYSVEPDAGWVDGYAYAQSIVHYFATSAVAKATVKTSLGQNDAESETFNLIPAERYHSATVNKPMAVCSGTIEGIAFGKIWNFMPFTNTTWGPKSDTQQKAYTCPRQPGGGSGGGSPGGGSTTCTTRLVDNYWYYPETGEWEFRYSEYQTICYPATT